MRILIFVMALLCIISNAQAANIPVVTAPVLEQNSGEMVRIKATTSPVQQADLTPLLPGVIKDIQFKSGQILKKDTVLFKLEDSVVEAQLNKARASFRYHDSNLNKYKQLLKTQAVAQIEVQRLQAERDQSLASVHELEATVAQYTVKAPFDGRVGLSNLAVGQYVVPGTTVVHISNSSQLWVDFPVPEKYINDIKNSQSVRIIADQQNKSLKPIEHSAKIIAMDDQFISNTHTLKVRALIDNPGDIYTPGSFVTVYFPTQTQTKLLSIPAAALIFNANGTFVYTLKQAKAHLQPIELAQVSDNRALITKGLTLADQVVVSGQINLREGAEVNITNNTGKI